MMLTLWPAQMAPYRAFARLEQTEDSIAGPTFVEPQHRRH
jgi:hypothetical protein